MTRLVRNVTMLMAALLLAALSAAAGTVTGVVRNGSTGQAAGGAGVVLIQLQNGMEPVANTKADAQGRYHFNYPQIGQQPMLLRATFQGISYYTPIPPGKADASIDISVYEPTSRSSAFRVLHQLIAFEPQNGNLLVAEEFDIQNQTKPPKSFYRPGDSFEFQLPKGAELGQVEASGPANMPVVQTTVDKGNNRYAISFPFQPGNSRVRVSFKMDYPTNQATLRLATLYPATMAMLLAPPKVKVIAEGFSSAGNYQGLSVYSRPKTKAGNTLVVSLSGTGSLPTGNGQEQDQAAGAQAGSDSNTVTPVAQALPPRLDSLRWILIVGFASLFVLGTIFLWWRSRNPVPAAAKAAGSAGAAPSSAPAHPAEPASGEQALRQSVEEIKETLFRLELRRQAGTLAEEEYLAQRQRLEKALRDLIKG